VFEICVDGVPEALAQEVPGLVSRASVALDAASVAQVAKAEIPG
jgi:hypothetical protein